MNQAKGIMLVLLVISVFFSIGLLKTCPVNGFVDCVCDLVAEKYPDVKE